MLNVTARQELLSRIADTISIVVEEARFDFSENGLNVRVVDPSHVAMVKLDVDAVAFEHHPFRRLLLDRANEKMIRRPKARRPPGLRRMELTPPPLPELPGDCSFGRPWFFC